MNNELITSDLVDLDLRSADKQEAVRGLAERLVTAGRVTDLERFLADVAEREKQMSTGMQGGIGIPHCRSEAVTAPTLAFGRCPEGVDFGAEDGPANLVFLIAAPQGGDSEHMSVLAALARRLVRAEFKRTLTESDDPAAVAEYVREEVTP
ncbi:MULTISPECIES: fructose PTS transporter subunit IIA [unclassified Actinopolyspora]|uniref:fructose PTS transporter subunit IIA n=1 Tax=Actinopolyspora TaxID=1849 RepID=UPI0013F5C40D|nr:PTS sugar transporter subunit IIA [Actinopolyspora sp. BKK2]NHE76559.1 PTS sugar transporter subunit IIA [Actinopolyspora sp. BKK1]